MCTGQGCAYAPLAGGLVLLMAIIIVLPAFGYLMGKGVGRRETLRRTASMEGDAAALRAWARHEVSATLAYLLVCAGMLLFIFGASGFIELQIPGAKIVTSLPGLVVVWLGYRIWTVAHRE